MEITVITLIMSAALSFAGMAVSMAFDKPRLIDFFYLACMALGGAALVLSFTGMLLNL
nr:MAG TPA: hypothetical protein [Caudoviricetes sp.]